MRGVAVVLGLAAALALGCRREPEPWSVLLVTLDTTRADHLGTYGYPHVDTPTLDGWAAAGVRFERCITPAPLTLPSHASLLTGLLPPSHGLHVNGDAALPSEAVTLAERLHDAGYATGAVIGAFVLDARFGLAQGFDKYDDDLTDGAQPSRYGYLQRDAKAVTDAALAFVRRARRPFFLWVHYFDPHAPYAAPDGESQRGRSGTPYDAEIGYVDSQLARLAQYLEKSGAAARTLVVATADHGEGLWEHGEVTHGLFVYESTLRVPLIVRFPDRRAAGTHVAQPVSLVDVAPSLLAWLGLPAIDGLDGRELPLADAPLAEERALYFENEGPEQIFGWSRLWGIASGDWKLVRAPRPELFDLRGDPYEMRDRFSDQEERARALLELSDRTRAEFAARRALPHANVSLAAEDERRLRALGYAGAPAGENGSSADPKDRVAVYHKLEAALTQVDEGALSKGVEMLVEIADRDDPGNRRALVVLGDLAVHEATVRPQAIDALWRAARRESSDTALRLSVQLSLGAALTEAERHEEALEALRLAAELDPDRPALHYRIGRAQESTGRLAEARASYQRALEGGTAEVDPRPWLEDARERSARLEKALATP